MGLKINGGKLCCVWGLRKCSDGTDSGIRVKASSIGGGSSAVVKIGATCYTVDTSLDCGTITSPSFTTVSGCSDAACTTSALPCSNCDTQYATSYTVGGWAGTFPAQSCAGDCCGGFLPGWDGDIDWIDGGASGFCAWEDPVVLYIGGSSAGRMRCTTATDGSNLAMQACYLRCFCPTSGNNCADIFWSILISFGDFTGVDTLTYRYLKFGGGPTGTYTPATGSYATGYATGGPATLTVS